MTDTPFCIMIPKDVKPAPKVSYALKGAICTEMYFTDFNLTGGSTGTEDRAQAVTEPTIPRLLKRFETYLNKRQERFGAYKFNLIRIETTPGHTIPASESRRVLTDCEGCKAGEVVKYGVTLNFVRGGRDWYTKPNEVAHKGANNKVEGAMLWATSAEAVHESKMSLVVGKTSVHRVAVLTTPASVAPDVVTETVLA